jgi:ankyrin repeat protein
VVTRQDKTAFLTRAASRGNLEMVRLLLDAGADPHGEAPIEAAVGSGKIEMVRLLLDAGANLHGDGTIVTAVQIQNVEMVRMLIAAGADPRGNAPLIAAVQGGRVEMVRLLLDAGANKDARNSEGMSAIELAAQLDMIDIVTLLLNVKAAPRNAVDRAASIEMATLLGAGKKTGGRTTKSSSPVLGALLCNAVSANDASRAEELLALVHPDAHNGGPSPIAIAARAGNMAMVKKLVEHGADVNPAWAYPDNLFSPLQEAIDSGHLDIAEYLRSQGARLLVMLDVSYVKKLFEQGGGSAVRKALASKLCTITGEMGNSAFFEMCRSSSLELITVLVESGANINAREDNLNDEEAFPQRVEEPDERERARLEAIEKMYGDELKPRASLPPGWYRDAVSQAIKGRNEGVAEYLLARGAKPCGYALAVAILQGRKDLQAVLLKSGAPVEGDALVAACEIGDIDLVKKFLSQPILIDYKGYNGLSPAETAYNSNHREILDLLIKEGSHFDK